MVLEKNKKVIVVVAHPDDETIWMGGIIMKNPQADWTIFSLCRLSDIDRALKFKRVCDYYKAECIMTDLDDENDIELNIVVKITKGIIKKELKNKKFDYLFTHGETGEYGHDRHRAVYVAINELISEGFLEIENILYFNYRKQDETQEYSEMIPRENSDIAVKLSPEEYDKKKNDVMVDIYGFDSEGIDANLCTRTEAFKRG